MKHRASDKPGLSEDARGRMRTAALARYDRAAQQTHERVRAMLQTITKEMEANQGIYPHNKGALSLAEIGRRAGIHPLTFHKPRYIAIRKEVQAWLETLKQEAVVGRTRARKALATRAQEWKQLYEDLLQAHRISETDLALAEARLEEALLENEKLRQRIAAITAQKVVSLRPVKG
ncbi:hypothetical protein GO283_03158 [Ralstonia solanacearum]|uniref:hypothetical protein n=1 Tax=Ralstonia solanacearum species complex TaxID=3116862 RepID=UPI000855BE2C|nr:MULTISPECIES: hypothetical protein [Ralstonia solanacearum species complex]AOE88468.1 hypothetical protein LBM341_00150 [Ralstonia solanacearum]MCK4149502.1 hypothetical protein [Ralstonia pseudosolanacearum]NJZ67140.1 hypothetical protein [Ralstonia solanacearum]NJZ79079.1 hypothetical protein [Ralstonia solanacearum]NJZ84444.1 hypothetical protein [Ralstonia solanacearum]